MIPKFRAWDKSRKLMIDDVVAIDVYHEYIGYLYASEIVQGETMRRLPINEAILMQYTGLKDKNGKEIYEGDIHEYGGRHFSVKFGYYTDEDTNVEMYGWYFDSNSIEEQGSLGVDSEEYVKIVGNIYENQELMEETWEE